MGWQVRAPSGRRAELCIPARFDALRTVSSRACRTRGGPPEGRQDWRCSGQPRSRANRVPRAGKPRTEPNKLRFRAGVRPSQWVGNCVAIGLSGGFMEPLESTSIHLIQRAVLRLLRMLPLGAISERDIAEFNDQQMQDMLHIRDFLILHYKATERRDSEFWRYVAEMPVPESLTHRMELFRETARVFRRNEELFQENSWVQVMMGQGIMPAAHHPIAAKLSDAEVAKLLGMIRDNVAQTVAALPEHHAYVAHYC